MQAQALQNQQAQAQARQNMSPPANNAEVGGASDAGSPAPKRQRQDSMGAFSPAVSAASPSSIPMQANGAPNMADALTQQNAAKAFSQNAGQFTPQQIAMMQQQQQALRRNNLLMHQQNQQMMQRNMMAQSSAAANLAAAGQGATAGNPAIPGNVSQTQMAALAANMGVTVEQYQQIMANQHMKKMAAIRQQQLMLQQQQAVAMQSQNGQAGMPGQMQAQQIGQNAQQHMGGQSLKRKASSPSMNNTTVGENAGSPAQVQQSPMQTAQQLIRDRIQAQQQVAPQAGQQQSPQSPQQQRAQAANQTTGQSSPKAQSKAAPKGKRNQNANKGKNSTAASAAPPTSTADAQMMPPPPSTPSATPTAAPTNQASPSSNIPDHSNMLGDMAFGGIDPTALGGIDPSMMAAAGLDMNNPNIAAAALKLPNSVADLENLMMGDEDFSKMLDDDTLGAFGEGLDFEALGNVWGPMGSGLAPDAGLSAPTSGSPLQAYCELTGHTNKVSTCAMSVDGKLLASAGHDKKVNVWSVVDKSLKYTLEGHTNQITQARFCSDDRALLATASFDKTVRIWKAGDANNTNAPSVECMTVFSSHSRSVTSVDFCPVGRTDVVCSLDGEGEMKVWNASSGSVEKTIKVMSQSKYSGYSANPLRFHPHSSSMVAVGLGTTLVLLDIEACANNTTTSDSSSTQSRTTPHTKNISSLDWSADGSYLVTGSDDVVCVWDALTLKALHTTPTQGNKISCCAFLSHCDGDGATGLGAQRAATDKIMNRLKVVFGEYENLYVWNFSGAGSGLAGGLGAGTGGSNNGGDNKPVAISSAQSGQISCLAIAPDPSTNGKGTNGGAPGTSGAAGAGADANGVSGLLLASGSLFKENNLKVWQVR